MHKNQYYSSLVLLLVLYYVYKCLVYIYLQT